MVFSGHSWLLTFLLGSCTFTGSTCWAPLSTTNIDALLNRGYDKLPAIVSSGQTIRTKGTLQVSPGYTNTTKKYMLGMDCGRFYDDHIESGHFVSRFRRMLTYIDFYDQLGQ